MAEVIDFEVKSNIGQAAKATEEYAGSVQDAQQAVNDLNQNLVIQNNVIDELESSVMDLEKKMIDTPKSAMGWTELNKTLAHTKLELKGENAALKDLNKEMKTAEGNLKTATKNQEDLNKGLKDGEKSAGIFSKGVKGIGLAFKAMGIGLIVAAFAALKAAIERNQKAMDLINKIVTTVSTTFNQVVEVLVDTYEWVTASSERFDGLSKVITGLITVALTPLKLSFYAIKLGVQQAMLAFEKSFLGSGDTKKIKELTAGIKETKDNIAEVAKEAVQAGGDIISNFGDAVGEIGAIGNMAVDGISKISVAANFAMAESAVEAGNAAKLAAANIQGLIEKYDREAELQRQIRDDVSLSMEERIAANEKLGTILDEQAAAMLNQQDIKINAAREELALNSANIDLQVALTEAINERAAIEAQITGFRSEQLTNINALQLEQAAIEEEAFNKKVEEENFLMELQNQNLLDSITNLEEKALKELEIQYNKDIAEIAQYENKEALIAEIDKKYATKRAAIEKKAADADKKMDKLTMKGKLDVAKTTFNAIATIMGKESKAAKAAAAASATVSALQGATSAFASLAPIPFVGPVLGGIAAAAALVAGYANVKQIYATKDASGSSGGGGGGGGGGSTPNVSTASADPESIAPQMVGGQFELGAGVEPEAAKAYVVTDEMSDSQEQLAGIRRRASV